MLTGFQFDHLNFDIPIGNLRLNWHERLMMHEMFVL